MSLIEGDNVYKLQFTKGYENIKIELEGNDDDSILAGLNYLKGVYEVNGLLCYNTVNKGNNITYYYSDTKYHKWLRELPLFRTIKKFKYILLYEPKYVKMGVEYWYPSLDE